jgi:hypothetical protein
MQYFVTLHCRTEDPITSDDVPSDLISSSGTQKAKRKNELGAFIEILNAITQIFCGKERWVVEWEAVSNTL